MFFVIPITEILYWKSAREKEKKLSNEKELLLETVMIILIVGYGLRIDIMGGSHCKGYDYKLMRIIKWR